VATAEKPAAPEKGAAAVAETAPPEPKALEWRGIALTLPASWPAMQMLVAWRRLTRASEDENGEAVMTGLIDLVDLIVGRDDRQADKVWQAIDQGDDDAADAVFDLLDHAAGLYGVESGE
jgi:hypothetical protein